ncbi:MAG: hypothetical protein AAF697_14450 [Pseudomonadota bacterium]
MSYRASFAPSAEARAIISASIKAGATGAAIVTVVFALGVLFGPSGQGPNIIALVTLSLVIGLIFGTLATAFCLTTIGWPLAILVRDRISTREGAVFAMICALAAIAGIALLASPLVSLVAFAYAVPAALFYRSAIIQERGIES